MPWVENDPLTPANLNAKMPSGFALSVRDAVYGATGDGTTDDTLAFQAALSAASDGQSVFVPPGTYLLSGVTMYGSGVALVSELVGPGSSDRGAILKHSSNTGALLTVVGNRPFLRGINFVGTSNDTERGEDVSSTAVLFDPASSADIDAVMDNCAILRFQNGVQLDGRNVRAVNTIVTSCKRGWYVPAGVPSDSRNLELYGCRFHSCGKSGTTTSAAVYVDPTANFQEVVISSFDCDSCTRLFYGFASGMVISGGPMNKMLGTGITVDATGHTLNLGRRVGLINGVTYWQINPVDVAGNGIEIVDSAFGMVVSSCVVSDSGGHGIVVGADRVQVSDCVVHSPGQFANNTYDGFHVTGAQARLRDCAAHQDRLTSATTKGRNGFTITGDDCSVSGLYADSAYATSLFSLGGTVEVMGIEPKTPSRHESWGTQAPTEGTWRTGDILWRTNPSYGTRVGYVCTGGGAPGTWHEFGLIGAGSSAILPTYPMVSEVSLGFYRSGNSTIAQSYGTLSLLNAKVENNVIVGGTIAGFGVFRGDTGVGKVELTSEAAAGYPDYTFSANTNTGMYSPAVNVVGISAAGSAVAKFGTSSVSLSGVTLDLKLAKLSLATTGTAVNNTNLGVDEIKLFIGGTSGATLCVRSGGTIYYFGSILSAAG